MRYGWAVALGISATFTTTTAQARDAVLTISVAGGNLGDALATLAAQTGISFGYDGALPALIVRPVKGRMTAREALDRLLRNTPIRAVPIGPTTYRLIRREQSRRQPNSGSVRSGPDPIGPTPEIVITARKFAEPLSRVPASVSVYLPGDMPAPGAVAGQRDVARSIDGLVVGNQGAGRDRAFVRGLADSPFDGFSQTTVSAQVDDGRITFDAAEPGLRLADVARVELLKGPQGPLYGTGALGGVYRVVTNRPVLGAASGKADFSIGKLAEGGAGTSGVAVLNLPVVTDVAAVRVVGYAMLDGGWIDDRPAPRDANQTNIAGLRAALRVVPAPGWTIDLGGAFQRIDARDSQYVYRTSEDLTRPVSMLEPKSTDLKLAQARIEGSLGSVQLVAATSQSWQNQSDIYSLAAAPATLGIPGATAYRDRRAYRVFDQEVRVTSAPDATFGWAAGLSYLLASTRATGEVQTGPGQWTPYFALHRSVTEAAMFVDGSFPLADRLRLTAGARLFRTSTEDERQETSTPSSSARALTGFTPSVSLSYDLSTGGIVYARFATAFRPGGIDPGNAQTGRYDADEVRSVELGGRLKFDGGRLALDIAGYGSQWRDMQSDYLEANGLIATHNVGDANVLGGDASLDWRPDRNWRFTAGVTVQRARLVHALGGTELPADRRLPLIPDIAFRLLAERRVSIGGLDLRPYIGVNFNGAARLSFDDGLDRAMPGYAVARTGASLTIDPVVFRIDIDNLFDTRADTFAYGNPFSIRTTSQYTPLRPRSVSLSVSRSF